MVCDHVTLTIEQREIYKDNIHVADVDIIICPKCKFFTLARMKRKDLKKAKKIVPAKPIPKANPQKAQVPVNQKQQPQAKPLVTQPRKSYGADNSPKPTGVNSNLKQPPVKPSPYPTPQSNLTVKGQAVSPLKTEAKKSKKK